MGHGNEDKYDLTILMLPWLAHGHISPYFELAKRLSHHRVLVYFCSTPVNLAYLTTGELDSIRLVELDLPVLPGLPPHLHTTKHLPSHLMPLLKQAFDMAEPSFERLLFRLKPDLVIYDFLQPWAPEAARRQDIPAVVFTTLSAAASCFYAHYRLKPTEPFPFPVQIGSGPDGDRSFIESNTRVSANKVSDGLRVTSCMNSSWSFVAVKSCREIEAEYIDYLSTLLEKEVLPVGHLIPEEEDKENEDRAIVVNGEILHCEQPILAWLNKKANSSVVFASFGSEYFMSAEELEELAQGLEQSGLDFIWVVRFPLKEQEEGGGGGGHGTGPCQLARALPTEFMERVKGGDRGLVIEGWAPQIKILKHSSVGGFLTHSGWSSVKEAMKCGVPMVALPLQLDQPINAKLAVSLGVAAEVKNETRGGKRPGFKREEVAEKIKEVVVGEEGEGLRRKAKQMAEVMRSKGDEEAKVFAEKMAELCRRKLTLD